MKNIESGPFILLIQFSLVATGCRNLEICFKTSFFGTIERMLATKQQQ